MQNNTPKRAALYVRVSTEEQHLQGQESELTAELERRGWSLAEVYRDKVSGAAGSKRPELERLRHDAALRRFGAVLVWSVSRLGRSTVDVLRLAEELHGRGVALVSLKEPVIDLSSSMGRFVLQIWAAIAELELAQIRERTRMGLAGARRRGKRLGRPPKVTGDQVANLVAMYPGDPRAKSKAARQLGITPQHVRRIIKAIKKGAKENVVVSPGLFVPLATRT